MQFKWKESIENILIDLKEKQLERRRFMFDCVKKAFEEVKECFAVEHNIEFIISNFDEENGLTISNEQIEVNGMVIKRFIYNINVKYEYFEKFKPIVNVISSLEKQNEIDTNVFQTSSRFTDGIPRSLKDITKEDIIRDYLARFNMYQIENI